MLTPRARASATTSSSTGTLPETMIPRSPSSIARSWMSRRSPTMISDFAAGMPSRSEIFQKERDVHRAQAHVELLVPRLVDRVDHGRLERAGDVGEGAVDLAHELRLAHPGDEDARRGGGGRSSRRPCRAASTTGRSAMSCRSMSSRASAQVAFSGTDDDARDHQVAHPGPDVAQVDRERLAEAAEDRVDPGVRVAAARRHMAPLAAGLLVGGVGDRRADRVGVGVAVADDVGGVGGGREGRGRHGPDCGAKSAEFKELDNTLDRNPSDRAP